MAPCKGAGPQFHFAAVPRNVGARSVGGEGLEGCDAVFRSSLSAEGDEVRTPCLD